MSVRMRKSKKQIEDSDWIYDEEFSKQVKRLYLLMYKKNRKNGRENKWKRKFMDLLKKMM